MAAKLTRLTHKIAIHLHIVAESCPICSSRSRWPVQKHPHIIQCYLEEQTYHNQVLLHNQVLFQFIVRTVLCLQLFKKTISYMLTESD
jgi:hypothetical protein